MRTKWAVTALAVLGLALTGCSGDKHDAPDTGVVVTEIETVTASTSAPAPTEAEAPTATETPTATQPPVQPTVETPAPPAGPVLGAPCIGADAGKTAVGPNGVAIMCDEYRWRENIGQDPRHSWADDQAKWNECRQTNTMEQCRKMLNP